jgi:hypothetical protein
MWADDLGPHTLGLIYAVAILISLWLGRAISGCCLQTQRSRLRDDYEQEIRRGGAMSNRLLLPGYART